MSVFQRVRRTKAGANTRSLSWYGYQVRDGSALRPAARRKKRHAHLLRLLRQSLNPRRRNQRKGHPQRPPDSPWEETGRGTARKGVLRGE